MLVAALCELKSRLLVDAEADEEEELDAEGAAEELALRLAEYQRFKRAAGWLAERRAAAGLRVFRTTPAPYAPPRPAAPLVDEQPGRLAEAMLHLLEPPARVDTTTIRRRAVAMRPFVERFRLLVRARGGFVFDDEVAGLERGAQAAAFVALLELIKRGEARAAQADLFEPIRVGAQRGHAARLGAGHGRDGGRGVSDALGRRLRGAAVRRRRAARRCTSSPPPPRSTRRPSSAPSTSWSGGSRSAARGVVLDRAGARYGLRAAPGGPAEAASRLQARAPERGLSPAALEALAVVAYLQPVGRPEIARIRGVSSDAVVAGLLERELIEEAGRGDGLGAPVLYRTTTTFERIFGLEDGIDGLPALEGDEELDSAELRQRLHAVAAERG